MERGNTSLQRHLPGTKDTYILHLFKDARFNSLVQNLRKNTCPNKLKNPEVCDLVCLLRLCFLNLTP